MKLRYRGVAYDYQPPELPIVEGGVGGTYRGANWNFRTLLSNPIPQISETLQYRGVMYHTNPSGADSGNGQYATSGREVGAGSGLFRRRQSNSVDQAHRESILKGLERRLQVARERGDQKLVKQLEDEWQQFA